MREKIEKEKKKERERKVRETKKESNFFDLITRTNTRFYASYKLRVFSFVPL